MPSTGRPAPVRRWLCHPDPPWPSKRMKFEADDDNRRHVINQENSQSDEVRIAALQRVCRGDITGSEGGRKGPQIEARPHRQRSFDKRQRKSTAALSFVILQGEHHD